LQAASINFLTQDEMRHLLDVIPSKRDYAIFLLAYRHGLRASEVGMLRTADLDLKQYRLRIQRAHLGLCYKQGLYYYRRSYLIMVTDSYKLEKLCKEVRLEMRRDTQQKSFSAQQKRFDVNFLSSRPLLRNKH
jgi:integrase